MTTFHCDKLCSGECCAHLIVALNAACIWNWTHEKTHVCAFCALTETIDGVRHRFPGKHPERLAAIDAAGDSAKLAELMATGLRERGLFVVCAKVGTAIHVHLPQPIVYVLTVPQARALLACVMATPPDASSKALVEALVRGEE